MLSEASAQAWPELALACGRVSEALEAAELSTASHPESVALCSQAITFAAQAALQVSFEDFLQLLESFKAVEALEIVTASYPESVA
jgi:hypothetical protein